MKIIKPGVVPPNWYGLQVYCKKCRATLEIEANEEVEYQRYNPTTLTHTGYVWCPCCNRPMTVYFRDHP